MKTREEVKEEIKDTIARYKETIWFGFPRQYGVSG